MAGEMDPAIDELVIAQARGALARWDARAQSRAVRAEAVRDKHPLAADTPDRLAARLNKLVDDVRLSTRGRRAPAAPALRRLVERPMPITAAEVTDTLVQEAVIAAKDFLSVEFLERGTVAARSVGRVVVRRGSGRWQARGTGFLVAPGILLTNHHVLPDAAFADRCAVEMDYEQNRFGTAKQSQTFHLGPARLFLADEALDYALVGVAERADGGAAIAGYGALPLDPSLGKIAVIGDDYVNVVQHPLGREKEVVIRNNRVLDLRTGADEGADLLGPFLHYEADTEKGSSGSPILNDEWGVVALHHAGVPARNDAGEWLNKSGGVWREGEQPVEDIQWIANEAVRVSSLVAAITTAADTPALREAIASVLAARVGGILPAPRATGAEPEEEAPAAPSRPAETQGGSAGSRRFTIDIPIRLSIEVGDVAIASAERARGTSARTAAADPSLQEALRPRDFADREGYDRDFLGVTAPLPAIKPSPRFGGLLRIPRPSRAGDDFELRYSRHSILMCAARRLAYVSAVNVDFAAPFTASRKQGTSSWSTDPRIDGKDQLDNRFYARNDYDKGHLTRRDDAAWGASLASAIKANNDTFFYPNAAPQHFKFNQADDFTHAGLDLWGDLENFISEQGGRQRLSIFNGPIFGDHDKRLFDALVPLRFYKIVLWKDAGEDAGAVGFDLDQADLVASLPEEAIDPGRFAIRQRRIADIEAELDISFGPVAAWDRMKVTAEEALGDGVPINALSDIRL